MQPGLASASLAVAVAVVLLAGGRGDDDDPAALTREQFVSEADRACVRAKERIGENTADLPDDLRTKNAFAPDLSDDDRRRFAPFAEQLGEVYGDLHADLAELEPPDQDKNEFDEILAGMRFGAGRFGDAAERFREGEPLEGTSPVEFLLGPSQRLVNLGANNCLGSGP